MTESQIIEAICDVVNDSDIPVDYKQRSRVYINSSMINRKWRIRELVTARQLAIIFMTYFLKESGKKVSIKLGYINHATGIFHRNKFLDYCSVDKNYALMVHEVMVRLNMSTMERSSMIKSLCSRNRVKFSLIVHGL